MSLAEHLFQDFIAQKRYMYLVEGLKNTLIITAGALVLGIILGVIAAIIRVQHQNKKTCSEKVGPLLFLANLIVNLYLTVIRGTPTIVQLMILTFAIWKSGQPIQVAIVAFGINSGAYVAEIIRSGIQSVDSGQTEAGRSLGLSARMTLQKIVLPQAFKNVAPAIFNEFISLVKETSVAGYVGIQDLTKGGDIIRSQTYDAFPPLLAVALIYLVIVIGLTQILGLLERRMARSDIR